MSKKRTSSSHAIVAQAMQQCGCSALRFATCAGLHTNMINFKPDLVAADLAKENIPIHAAIKVFSGWIVVTDPKAVRGKHFCATGREPAKKAPQVATQAAA